MADMTATTMATYLPEVWSRLASVTYRSNVVLPDLMDRRWEPEIGVGRGDTVNIPNFTQNNSANKRGTFGTGAAITFDAVTESQTQLAINQLAYKAFRMPVEMSAQAMSTYVPMLTDGIGQAIALTVDSELAGDDTNGIDSFTTTAGTDNVDVTDDDVLEAETNLGNANAPLQSRYMVVSPATRASLMKIDVYRNSLYGGAVGNLPGDKGAGFIGNVYSLGVYESNNLEAGAAGKKNGVFQTEAIAYAAQKELTMLNDMNIEDGMFNQVAGYMVYGFIKVKDNFGTELDGK
ncbi:MAG: hypothetical protein GWN86_06900 [Desulfobacterales bacterium]|nr:hypothetical protein [Desulfobacterales bacterium]